MGSWQMWAAAAAQAEGCRIHGCWCVISPSKKQGGRGEHIPVTASWDCWGNWVRELSLYHTYISSCSPLEVKPGLSVAPLSWGGLGLQQWGCGVPGALLKTWWSTWASWVWGLAWNCHRDMPFLSRGKCLELRYPDFQFLLCQSLRKWWWG